MAMRTLSPMQVGILRAGWALRKTLAAVGSLGAFLAPLFVIYALFAASDMHDKQVAQSAIASACFDGDVKC